MPEGIPTTPVPMPSADLVTFRFDQMDKEMVSLHNKLDGLTANFALKTDMQEVNTRLQDHENRLRGLGSDRDRLQGAIKVVYAALILLVGAVGALWWVRG